MKTYTQEEAQKMKWEKLMYMIEFLHKQEIITDAIHKQMRSLAESLQP